MKECRKIEITNFKNIGIRQSTTLDLPPKNSGDLIFIIGENNVGKSNVLDALQAFGNKHNPAYKQNQRQKPHDYVNRCRKGL